MKSSFLRVTRVSDQAVIADQVLRADQFWSRLRGWIGKKEITATEGLWFPRCNSLHMWWMSLPIDMVFLAKQENGLYRVCSTHAHVQPWRILPLWNSRASDALELCDGAVGRAQLKVGEELLCSS